MNRREYRKRTIEQSENFMDIRRRECIVSENKLQFEMDRFQKDNIIDTVKATVKLVKLEIKDILDEKDKKEK